MAETNDNPAPVGATAYDVALLVGKSFGRFLPFVALFAGLAVAVWFLYKEVENTNNRNKRLTDELTSQRLAVIKEKADAQVQVEEAQRKAAESNATYLLSLNKEMSSVASSIQNLVNEQLVNISKMHDLSAKNLNDLEVERGKLNEEVERLKKEKADAVEGVILSEYQARMKSLGDAAAGVGFPGFDVTSWFDGNMKDSRIVQAMEHDSSDSSINWKVRIFLEARLYVYSKDQRRFDNAITLLRNNHNYMDQAAVNMFFNAINLGGPQEKQIMELAVADINDDSLPKDARRAFASRFFIDTAESRATLGSMDKSNLRKLSASVWQFYVESISGPYPNCSSPPSLLHLAPNDAEKFFEWKAIQTPNAVPEQAKTCLVLQYTNTYGQPDKAQPSAQAIQYWSGP
jgi:hypothetical protein